VNEIAAPIGGGGHSGGAGARIPGKPLSVQRKVIAAINARVVPTGKFSCKNFSPLRRAFS